MMTGQRFRIVTGLWIGVAALAIAGASAAQVAGARGAEVDCGNARKMTRFGNPVTRFSPPVQSREALVQLFETARIDVELLLRQAGWAGDPNDLYQAVRSGSVTRQTFNPGQRFGWMFFRDNGQPALKSDLCWAGKAAFAGWEIQFTSRGQWYSMVVPEDCGNLSFLAQQAEPVCRITVNDPAGKACKDTTIAIDASGSSGALTLEVLTPSGQRRTFGAAEATAPGRWRFESAERNGTFRFTVTGRETTPRGTPLECRAETTAERACEEPCVPGTPSIDLTASASSVEPWEEVKLEAAPKVGDCAKIERVTIDGQTVAPPYSQTKSWDAPGSYTVEATVADNFGGTARDAETITVTECRTKECKQKMREMRRGAAGDSTGWVLRPFVGVVKTSDDQVFQTFAGGTDRRRYHLESEMGFGLGAEYKLRDWFGISFGAFQADTDLHLELDIAQLWGMDEDNLSTFTLFAGPTFHLTPRSRVDLFAGPVLAYTDFGSVDFSTIGVRIRRDFDSELGLGAQVGLDIPFRADGKWGLHLGTIYLDATAETGDDFEIAVDPWLFNVGLSYRFKH